MQRFIQISTSCFELVWDGVDHARRKRHEAMWRAMAGSEIGGNDKRRDPASVFSSMSNAAQFWR
jgi:hypothetical protein